MNEKEIRNMHNLSRYEISAELSIASSSLRCCIAEIFFQDFSSDLEAGLQVWDDTLALLSTFPNVLITPHSAFLTNEALVRVLAILIVVYSNVSLKECSLQTEG